MNGLPLAAFPIVGKTTQSSSFVLAVLIGLAIFMATKNKTQTSQQRP